MRDSNYKSVSNNRAAVTITTSLYDRRALDVTSDKPLVNSLNHLTYLVSSLAKVRETLSVDGGIERLVEILHECHNVTFSAQDNIFNSEKKLLTAWKWTLAFQCLVLIGTRGTEKIRQGLVKAGILPVIATVLDNYLSLHERTFTHANSRQGMYGDLQQQHNEVLSAQVPDNAASPLVTAPDTAEGINSLNPFNSTSDNNIFAGELQSLDREFSTGNGDGNEHENNNTNNTAFPEINDSLSQNSINNVALQGSNQGSLPFAGVSTFSSSFTSNLTSDDYDSLAVDQLFKLIRISSPSSVGQGHDCSISNDLRRRFIIVNVIKKLTQEKNDEILDNRFINDSDYDMDNGLQFLSDLYLQDDKSTQLSTFVNSKISPRNFTETGVVIPKDDDIVWSLQLLAYISKYPYLKEILQNTHLLINMSIRDKKLKLFIERQMKSKLKKSLELSTKKATIQGRINRDISPYPVKRVNESGIDRFDTSASNSPQMSNDINEIHNDEITLEDDKFDLTQNRTAYEGDEILNHNENRVFKLLLVEGRYEGATRVHLDSDKMNEELEDLKEDELQNGNHDAKGSVSESHSELSKLYDQIVNAESIVDDMDREIALYHMHERINRSIDIECKKLSNTIIKKRKEQKEFLESKWNYDTYDNFDIDIDNFQRDSDYDEALMEYKKINLFPIVEKFTFLAGTDMYYWSGVIMRNSCRRNESKGGVRQCGNLECGKWEKYPREFLKCRKCKRTKYCSRECQMRAWHCHRNWCIQSNTSSGSSVASNMNNNGGPNDSNVASTNDDGGPSQSSQDSG